MTGPDSSAGLSFGPAADVYERSRPPYPPAAVDWLLPAGARRVLDLGAGTGKLTRQLVDGVRHVVAVEPLEQMRDVGRREVPEVEFLDGTAERIPVLAASVDVVLVAQAWHWVDPQRAVPEVARVLAPGGRLGLVWNDRDERVAWVRELGRIMQEGTAGPPDMAHPVIGEPFGEPETLAVEWAHHTTPGILIDMVTSRSYFIAASKRQQEKTLAAVRALLADDPQLRDSAEIALPYVTRCFRVDLPRT
jgi:SAM-dependent methyltransferase